MNDVVYDPSKNPGSATLPGVPLANMTEAEFKALPAWLQDSVIACPFYDVPEPLRPIGRAEPGTPIPPAEADEVTNHV